MKFIDGLSTETILWKNKVKKLGTAPYILIEEMIFLDSSGIDMKINCPLDYELVSPNYGAAEVVSGEKKFGNRIIKYTLLDPQQRMPDVYDLIIKAIVPTSTTFENTITIKF